MNESQQMNEMYERVEEAADLLRVMAHPERLLVLCQLTTGEVGAGVLQQRSSLSQSAFSQHLTVLRKHELVQVRKEAQQVFYSLKDERAAALITSMHSIFCAQELA